MTIHTYAPLVVLSTRTYRLWFADAHEAAQWLMRARAEHAELPAVQCYYPTDAAPRLPAIPRQAS